MWVFDPAHSIPEDRNILTNVLVQTCSPSDQSARSEFRKKYKEKIGILTGDPPGSNSVGESCRAPEAWDFKSLTDIKFRSEDINRHAH